MIDLLDQISALIASPTRDLGQIEHTLTDGYACALSLEAERWRLERRAGELSRELESGDLVANARELVALAARLEDNSRDLSRLRGLLSELRRHAHGVRVGSPTG